MIEELDVLWWVIVPTILVIASVGVFFTIRIKKDPDPLSKAFRLLKLNLLMVGPFLAIMLLFALPQTSILSTFGYPKSIEDIQSPKLVLEYLQSYNRALVRTTQALYWFIFIFTVWFLPSIYTFTKAITEAMTERNKNL